MDYFSLPPHNDNDPEDDDTENNSKPGAASFFGASGTTGAPTGNGPSSPNSNSGSNNNGSSNTSSSLHFSASEYQQISNTWGHLASDMVHATHGVMIKLKNDEEFLITRHRIELPPSLTSEWCAAAMEHSNIHWNGTGELSASNISVQDRMLMRAHAMAADIKFTDHNDATKPLTYQELLTVQAMALKLKPSRPNPAPPGSPSGTSQSTVPPPPAGSSPQPT
jgi:hypothetical protein